MRLARPNYFLLSVACFLISANVPAAHAQGTADPDAEVVGVPDGSHPAQVMDEAWTRLTNALTGTKNTDTRIAAVESLSLLGGDARAEKLIRPVLHDADIDVRLAAIVAAGEMGKKMGPRSDFAPEIRDMLNDPDPKVAFTSASTLWKMDDPSGEDILMAVAEGDRNGDYNFWKGSKHNASRTLHSPAALAKIAAQQGMVILVPPVGMGMGAYGYLKGAGGPNPQVVAITEIAKEHTDPVKESLLLATKVKDAGARTAAAEALVNFRGPDVLEALRVLQEDGKEHVRLTASAAYIRVATTAAPKAAVRGAGAKAPVKH